MQSSTAVPLDAETKVAERPGDHEAELRLWLRLLTCSTLIEGEIRRRLREVYGVTLPRFDLMAQLDKTPGGMTLGELSQRMMVSNCNVTGLTERLVAAGLVAFSLGTDTAGSGRVPAGFNELVGLKPTLGLVSKRGVVPACRSLDCISILAHDVADAWCVLEQMAAFDALDGYARHVASQCIAHAAPRIAIPD